MIGRAVVGEIENIRFLFYCEINGVFEDFDETGQNQFQIVLALQLREEDGDDVVLGLIRQREVQDVQTRLDELEVKGLPVVCCGVGVEEVGFQAVEILVVVESEPHNAVEQ